MTDLQNYMESQDRIRVEHHRRTETHWIGKTYETTEDVLKLNSIGCELPLRNIYTRIILSN